MIDERPSTLDGWLGYLETLHPKPIAMGLDRVRAVFERARIGLRCPVVTVGGTNGKGSTCAMIESILRCSGYRTGLYTSPHLLRYNERVVVDGVAADDDVLMAAFAAVEEARSAFTPAVPLTYFEFGTLAALWSFARARLDAVVLEVGLGGRLDAVNVVDPDVAVITSVDLDHMDYLGPTREDIGREKAGIFRGDRFAICGDPDPPRSLVLHAQTIGASLLRLGSEFGYVEEGAQWRYRGPGGPRYGLPAPALRGTFQLANAACALAALGVLRDRLPLSSGALRDGLLRVELAGRFTVLPGRPAVVLDVAHNPHAARALARTLGEMGYHSRTLAVFGMLKDKDVAGVGRAIAERVDAWFVGSLPGPRGGSAQDIAAQLRHGGIAASAIQEHVDIASAWRAAQVAATDADRIVVFGSFLTVAAAWAAGRSPPPHSRTT